MTDEQIKQNALKAEKEHGNFNYQYQGEAFNKGYIAGAHSRDEEVTRLSAEIEDDNYVISKFQEELNKLRNPWINAENRPPEEENNPDEYNAPHRVRSSRNVIITDGTVINRGYYSYARMRWEWNEGEIKVTHWMPIPQIEKGE